MEFNVPFGAQCFTTMGDRLLPVSVVGRRLGLSPRMVRYLIADNELPAVRRGRKLLFCREADVREYLRRCPARRRRHGQ